MPPPAYGGTEAVVDNLARGGPATGHRPHLADLTGDDTVADPSRLPGAVAHAWEWQRRGICQAADTSMFFQPDAATGAGRRQRETAAVAVCMRCPVRAECAAYALATGEPYGVWGGFTEAELRRLRAIGWKDLADPRRRVDVDALRARLTARTHRGYRIRPSG